MRLSDWWVPRDRILSAVSEDGIHFRREPGVRVDAGSGDGFPGEMVYDSFVHRPGLGEQAWEMLFRSSVRKNGEWRSRIMRAVSQDGLAWENFAVVLEDGRDGLCWRDVRSPMTILTSQGRQLFFSAQGQDGRRRIFSIHGEKMEPVECLVEAGQDVAGPCVVEVEEGLWRMYFSEGEERGQKVIRCAHSHNLREWKLEDWRMRGERREKWLHDPCVIKTQDKWWMYFRVACQPPLQSAIHVAVSGDGLAWERLGCVLKADIWNRHEGQGVEFPWVCQDHGSFRLYYTGYWGGPFQWKTVLYYQLRQWGWK